MEIASIIDEELLPPHGNRKGLSYGELSVLFLAYIISQSDHRLCAVESWVEQHRQTLLMATEWKIGAKEATDDRLADLLSVLGSSQSQETENIALRLGHKTIRAYELPTDKARSDTTSFSVYHQPRTETKEENLLHFGYSKDHRPDLVQYRQMLATLEPMGLPLLGATLAGNKTDESDYLPTWQKLAKMIGHKDFLFLADSKASTWKNRALIDSEGGIYCFPLAMFQPRPQLLLKWVTNAPILIEEIYEDEEDSDWPIGEGFEVPLGSIWFNPQNQQMFLLTIALSIFTLMEFVVRRQLAKLKQFISGLYSGNPKRQTARPTAEQLLATFCNLTLYLYPDGSTEISSLNSLQRQILNRYENSRINLSNSEASS